MGVKTHILDWSLFAIVTAVIAIISGIMFHAYISQYEAYRDLTTTQIALVKNDASGDDAGEMQIRALVYLQVAEASLLRICCTFLSFVLIYIGALYVLRTATSSFSASIEGATFKAAMQASSPGLLLATLGVTVLLVTFLHSASKIPPQGSVVTDKFAPR